MEDQIQQDQSENKNVSTTPTLTATNSPMSSSDHTPPSTVQTSVEDNERDDDGESAESTGGNSAASPLSDTIVIPNQDLITRRKELAQLLARGSTEPTKEGDKWYLIPRDFLEDVMNLAVETFDELRSEVGALDLSSIVDRQGNLYPENDEPVDTYNVSPPVFQLLVDWFEVRGEPVSRAIIVNPEAGHKEVERFPSFFQVHTLTKKDTNYGQNISHGHTTNSIPRHGVHMSTTSTFNDLFDAIQRKILRAPQKPRQFRVWFITSEDIDLLPNSISLSTFVNDIPKKQLVLQTRYGQRLKDQGLTSPFYHVLVESSASSSIPYTFPTDTYFKSLDSKTSSISQSAGGNLGLANLGNTCYMNSALQCLLHIPEVNEYFFYKVFESELNDSNPLGFKGQIAKVFGALLHKLFSSPLDGLNNGPSTTSSNPSNLSVSPRDFKYTIGHYSSLFQGYQQQDSQEFLSWLLDALHEDLNRIYDKPYCEKPELTDAEVGDPLCVARLAQTCWSQHKHRNDSVIIDLFTGLYQSTLVCPDCNKSSITFDPFNDLTLPLPVNKKWYHTFTVVDLASGGKLSKFEVELSKTSNYDELIAYLSLRLGFDSSSLFLFEIFNNFFYKDFQSSYDKIRFYPISEIISENDEVAIYHIPHNPETDVIVPVIHSVMDSDKSYNVARSFGVPLFVVLKENDMKCFETIKDKLIESTKILKSGESVEIDQRESEMQDVANIETSEVPEPSAVPESTEILDVPMDDGDLFSIKYYAERKSVLSRPTSRLIHIPHNRANLNNLPNLTDLFPRIVASEQTQQDLEQDEFIVVENRFPGTPQPSSSLSDEDTECEENLGSLFDSVHELPVTTDVPNTSASSTGEIGDKMTLVCQWDHDSYVREFGDNDAEHSWSHPTIISNPEVEESKRKLKAEQNSTVSLYDCLRAFSTPEVLGDQDLWYCPKCKDHKQATKTIQLWATGDILTIHLKRFESARSFSDKIDMVVDFPVNEPLDMSEFVQDNDSKYDLIAVDNHYGGLGGGHYTAYAKNFRDDEWYYFNDSRVTKVADPTECVTGAAYLLFYRKRGTNLGGDKLQSLIDAGRESFAQEVEQVKENILKLKEQIDIYRFNEHDLEEAKRKLIESENTGEGEDSAVVDDEESAVTKDDTGSIPGPSSSSSSSSGSTKKSRSSIDPSELRNEDINSALHRKQRLITRDNRPVGIRPSNSTVESVLNSPLGSSDENSSSDVPSNSIQSEPVPLEDEIPGENQSHPIE
ncbi:ubiquitin carboxyl-terminal hydrolase 12 [[Candida] anglica]